MSRTAPSQETPAAWFSEHFCILGEAGRKAISAVLISLFFLHAALHFQILSGSIRFLLFPSFPLFVQKVADFSQSYTPVALNEGRKVLRASRTIERRLLGGGNRVSAPQETLWESTQPWAIHPNSLNCRKSNILNLKIYTRMTFSHSASLSALKVSSTTPDSLISNTPYRFSLQPILALFYLASKSFLATLILPLNRLCWKAGKCPGYNALQ